MSAAQSQKDRLFGPFRFDPVNQCLWRGRRRLALRPKAFAVLHTLVEHAGRLVTKEELLNAVWPDISVSDGVLRFCLRELREVLGDTPQAPQFIETVHRRGYRFIKPVRSLGSRVQSQEEARDLKLETWGAGKLASSLQPLASSFVGREAELGQLHQWLEQALGGERQIVFVTGEPGIGKTMFVGAFVERVKAKRALWIGHGQCVEQYGAGESYMPVLEALERLGRERRTSQLVPLLRQYAPLWLAQCPSLLKPDERAALERELQTTTRERMLRELAVFLEVFTTETPLVLTVEDAQWSDASSLNLIAYLARRGEPARLLLLVTARPGARRDNTERLREMQQELQVHGQCVELPLKGLTMEDVGHYLQVRFPQTVLPTRLVAGLHQCTGGNPLFLVTIVDECVARGATTPVDGSWALQRELETVTGRVPASLQRLMEIQSKGLTSEEQQVLEAASIVGVEFSAAAVAAALEINIAEVEELCAGLANQQQFLRLLGLSEWPDGTLAAYYGFRHALHQHVWHERVTVSRRQHLHQRIGIRKEMAYDARANEIATELAVHFEQGRDYRRAVQYLRQAADNALRRSAYQEAIDHLTKGLKLLKTLPDTPERAQQELALHLALGVPLIAAKGHPAPEVEHAYTRARELCQQMGETAQLCPVLLGLGASYAVRGELRVARELGEQLLRLVQSIQDPALLLETHMLYGSLLVWLGELVPGRAYLEQGVALYDPQQHRFRAFLYGQDPGVVCRVMASYALWLLGYPEQALRRSQDALALARELAHPHSLAFALNWAAMLHLLHREGQTAQEQAEAAIVLSHEHGFSHLAAVVTALWGGALVEQGEGAEGIVQLRQGLSACLTTGAGLTRPYLLALLAEAYEQLGQVEEGLSVLAEALNVMHKTGEQWCEAELYRLKGELLLKSRVRRPASEAEACFRQAIDIARRQGARSLELRAVMSLSRLWQRQGKKDEARQLLAEIYGWFTEGFDTKDLQEAKALLQELA